MKYKTFFNNENISESIAFNCILAMSGGYQDAYTFFMRDGVFSNAQTGNIVLLSQNLMTHGWGKAFRYFIPVIAFVLGVLAAEGIRYIFKSSKLLAGKVRWRQVALIVEIAILFVVGFIPEEFNVLATVLVSFSCAMQVQAFRKLNGYAYSSTMCIGNLRSGTDAFATYIRTRQREYLTRMLHYYGIIIVFGIGAGLGGVVSNAIGIKSIWGSAILLSICSILYCFRKKEIR